MEGIERNREGEERRSERQRGREGERKRREGGRLGGLGKGEEKRLIFGYLTSQLDAKYH